MMDRSGVRTPGLSLGRLTVTALVLCLFSVKAEQRDPSDIQNFLVALEGSETETTHEEKEESPMWGLPDATAVVGKVFKYAIPKEIAKDGAKTIEIFEAGQKSLPGWLSYDNTKQLLQGLAGPTEVGNQIFLQVMAHGGYQNESRSADIFSLTVINEEDYLDPMTLMTNNVQGDKPVKCPTTSSVTMATIILDLEFALLSGLQRLEVLEKMGEQLGLTADHLSLLPVGNKPMFDSSALVAGPGDVKQPVNSGALLQWVVGCGNVQAEHMPILQNVESTSKDGSMGKAVGHGLIGWHVTNNKLQTLQRMKRQARYMHTPTMGPTVGPPTRQPVPTVIVDETDMPVTRVVPTMASPIFPDNVKPTKTHHHHHHHHRTKTHGRHHHHTKHPYHSPKHQATRTMKTVMPTPTMQPILPTRVVDVTPTVVDTSLGRVPPTFGVPSPGVSRTGVLQPSDTYTYTDKPTQPTEILPTRTFTMPDTTSTDHIAPTTTDRTTRPTETTTTESTTTTKKTTPIPPTPPTPPPFPHTPKGEETDTAPSVTEEPYNYAPFVKEGLSRVDAYVGQVLDYKIQQATFFDFEDGHTDKLKLVLLAMDGLSLPRNSWVQLNATTQTLFGLPLPEHEGRKEYLLAAIDSGSKIARNSFEIVVHRRPHENKISHEFSMTLDLDYEKFLTDVSKRIEIANKLARAFGDSDTSKITVTKIRSGSVVYSWTNNSIPSETCPTRAIGQLFSYMADDKKRLNQTFVEAMKPYKVLGAAVAPRGPCVDANIPSVDTDGEDTDDGEKNPVPRETSDEEIMVTTVVPAVVIVCILLLAACIACCLYRKKRKGKLSDEDQNTFVNKGVPIIFADELEDRPDAASKPLILSEEKPPLPPPGYPRSGSRTPPSTPCSGHKEPYDTEEENYESSMTQPLYQPPPPFTGTGSGGRRHHRPRQQPAYRNPPPYVPP